VTQEAFAKNGESGLAMWKNHLFLAKKNATTRVVAFFVEIPRGVCFTFICLSANDDSAIAPRVRHPW